MQRFKWWVTCTNWSIFLLDLRYTAVCMISFYQNRKCKTFLFLIFCGNFFTYFEKYQPATEPAITRCCAATTNWVIQSRPNIWYLYKYIWSQQKSVISGVLCKIVPFLVQLSCMVFFSIFWGKFFCWYSNGPEQKSTKLFLSEICVYIYTKVYFTIYNFSLSI